MYDNQNYPYHVLDQDLEQSSINMTEEIKSSNCTPQKENIPKSGKLRKVMGLVCAGLIFGCCAGLSIIVILNLFPQNNTKQTEEVKKEIEIKKTQEVNRDQSANKSLADTGAYTQEGGIGATATTDSSTDTSSMAVVTDVTNVVDSVMPSVVSIFGKYAVTADYWGYELQQEQEGSGSGIIVGENNEELLIVTNNHVVADSTSLSVQFIDDMTCNAIVKGTNADNDLAVIAVELRDLSEETKEKIKIATLGDSDQLKVGEPAIAIGNALGYGQSVTTGVISAVNREYAMDENGNKPILIQTDAAINPGNSGGALLNVYGEVIGINSNKLAGTTIEGMGYAIPISTAKPVIEELMSKKTRVPVSESKKGYLGISGINVTDDVKDTYGLPVGVYIAQVFDGTAAQRSGLEKGDIITSFDGESIETMEELSSLLDCSEEGSEIQIGIMKSTTNGYEPKTITVRLGGRS